MHQKMKVVTLNTSSEKWLVWRLGSEWPLIVIVLIQRIQNRFCCFICTQLIQIRFGFRAESGVDYWEQIEEALGSRGWWCIHNTKPAFESKLHFLYPRGGNSPSPGRNACYNRTPRDSERVYWPAFIIENESWKCNSLILTFNNCDSDLARMSTFVSDSWRSFYD